MAGKSHNDLASGDTQEMFAISLPYKATIPLWNVQGYNRIFVPKSIAEVDFLLGIHFWNQINL